MVMEKVNTDMFYVGFSDDKFHPVMSFDAQGKEQTASYVAFRSHGNGRH